jgi:hypothetical protein
VDAMLNFKLNKKSNKMGYEEQIKKVKEILKANDIEMSVNGCGCCGSPTVSFSYKGEVIIDEESDFKFDTYDE